MEWFYKRIVRKSNKGNQNIICRAFCRWQRNQFPFVHKINKIILRTRLYFAPLWLDIHSQVRRVDSQITEVKTTQIQSFYSSMIRLSPVLEMFAFSNIKMTRHNTMTCALWAWGPALGLWAWTLDTRTTRGRWLGPECTWSRYQSHTGGTGLQTPGRTHAIKHTRTAVR